MINPKKIINKNLTCNNEVYPDTHNRYYHHMERSIMASIEQARNLGPTSAKILKSIDIYTIDDLKRVGWKEASFKLAMKNPQHINLNFITSLIGALTNEDWRTINPDLKEEAKDLIRALKKS